MLALVESSAQSRPAHEFDVKERCSAANRQWGRHLRFCRPGQESKKEKKRKSKMKIKIRKRIKRKSKSKSRIPR